jgi:hypothetical protein
VWHSLSQVSSFRSGSGQKPNAMSPLLLLLLLLLLLC